MLHCGVVIPPCVGRWSAPQIMLNVVPDVVISQVCSGLSLIANICRRKFNYDFKQKYNWKSKCGHCEREFWLPGLGAKLRQKPPRKQPVTMSTGCMHSSTEAPMNGDAEEGQADPRTVQWRTWSLTWQHGMLGRAMPFESQSLGLNSRPTYQLYNFGLKFSESKLPCPQFGTITSSTSQGCTKNQLLILQPRSLLAFNLGSIQNSGRKSGPWSWMVAFRSVLYYLLAMWPWTS